jgi:sphingomyelin phosphodiesterase acid-like 3
VFSAATKSRAAAHGRERYHVCIMRKAAAVLVVLLAFALPAAAEQFLSVSDIHFNPFAEPALIAKLEAADVAQWNAILTSSGVETFSTYGSDINDALLRSAVAEMKKQLPSPAFVLISGDFLAHNFQQTYQQYATDKSQAAYTAFVTKTIAYVAGRLRTAYPGVPIYPVLGNNDSDCGDYAVAPDSVFLANFRDIWKPAVRSQSFDRRFPTGGYYHADVATLKDVRIIGLNTNFFSTNYKNPCGKPGPDPGLQQLEWLDAELRLAAQEGKRVWMLFHIPPGLDVYDSEEWGGACPNVKPQTFWKDQYQQQYLQLATEHHKTILGTFAGHTHQDEFRFAGGDFIHVTPSVSPVFGNNPAFEIVDVSSRGDVGGYTAHHLANVTLPWSREYSFDEAYAKPRYNAATLNALATEIGSDTATRAEYFDYYSSGAAKPSAQALAMWRGYWCGLRTMTGSAFAACYCAD